MKIHAFHCPYCGGNIKFDLDSGRKFCFCTHCGQQVILDDEVIRTEHTEKIIDYAQIEQEKTKRKAMAGYRLYIILVFVLMAIMIIGGFVAMIIESLN